VADRLHRYAEAGVTTLSLSLYDTDLASARNTLRQMAEAFDRSGLAG
jgi:hypothetical protein